jgi:Putative transposase/Transposase zinc-binding domain
VCHSLEQVSASVELADIFVKHADHYIAQHGGSPFQQKALYTISRCRTSALGGHVLRCNHCGALEHSYNSCRYRHCPKCQTSKQLRWLQERKAELLPVPYFHVVFTLPHELNPIASYNPVVIYNLLFKAAWATLDTLGRDKKRLNGIMGMMAFLHTWGQNLSQHIHLHCLIPAGALAETDEGIRWKASKKTYLFPAKVMAKLFGKLFLSALRKAYSNQELLFKGCISELSKQQVFTLFQAKLAKKSWNVYAKEPFNGAEGGIEYLARYFAKTAISNERLLSVDDQQVTFKWRDYSDNNKTKIMALEVHEFIRRYLTHILPDRFMRVRYFGFLASAVKKKSIELIRSLLNPLAQDTSNKTHLADNIKSESTQESLAELMKRVANIDIELCKQCKIGRLQKIQQLLPYAALPPAGWDTS